VESNDFSPKNTNSNTIVESNEVLLAHNSLRDVITEKFTDKPILSVITDKEPNTISDKAVQTVQEVMQLPTKQLHPLDNSKDQHTIPTSPQLHKCVRLTSNNFTAIADKSNNNSIIKINNDNRIPTPNKRIIESNPRPKKGTMLGISPPKKHKLEGIMTTRMHNIEQSITPKKGSIEGITTPKKKSQKVHDDPSQNIIQISPRLRKTLVSVSFVKDSDSTSQHSVSNHEDKDYRPSESSENEDSDEEDTISSNNETSNIDNRLAVCHDNVDDDASQHHSSDAEDEDYTPSVCNDDDLHLDSDMERTDEDVSHDASYQADLKQYHKEAFYRAYAPYYKGASNSTKLITNEKYDRIKDIISKPKPKMNQPSS
jgi:hypothetical protein